MSQGRLNHIMADIVGIHEQGVGADLESYPVYNDPYFRQQVEAYLLPQVLSHYGKPSDALVLPILYDAPTLVDSLFSLVLVYRSQRFLVEYIFPNGAAGEDYVACPSETGDITLFAWSPGSVPSLEDIAPQLSGLGMDELSVDYYRPIEEATSMTLDEFYHLYSSPAQSGCLETPSALWPY
jgi:hypothetical protein